MAFRPKIVLFDVVETMFSLRPVAAALVPLGVSVEVFFARLLRDGFALAAAGTYEPFRSVASSAIGTLAPHGSSQQHDAVLAAFEQLPAHPDVDPALTLLAEAGVTVCALTNGSSDATVALLEASGLQDKVERVLSVDEVQRWKPAPEPYRHGADQLGADARDIALVAVHSWDVHGAHHAGLTTGWCSRLEGVYPSIFDAPDVSGTDLVAVATGLLALPVASS
ncbi:MAG: haloacid dehalogenase type II [Acidimicrobiales bacterium]